MSLRIFDGFRFSKLDTPIHNLDPRVKFSVAVVLFSIALLFTNVIPLVLLLIIQIPILIAAHVFRRWAASMRGGLLLAVLIFVTNFFFGSTLIFSIAMTLRFLSIMSAFSLFFITTSPDDLGLAMEQSKIPYAISFTFTTAVRLVPTIAVDTQTVVDAQRSRGLELDKGNFLRRIRNYIPVLIPLIVSAIRRSIELAEALESRAFGASQKRQPYVVLRMRLADWVALTLTALLGIIAAYTYVAVPLPDIQIPFTPPSLWPG